MMKRKSRHQFYRCVFFVTFLGAVSCSRDDSVKPVSTYNQGASQYYSYPQSYERYTRPNSRAYQNPYTNPPRNYYPYYDADYYYIPPTNYQNIEPNIGLDPNIK